MPTGTRVFLPTTKGDRGERHWERDISFLVTKTSPLTNNLYLNLSSPSLFVVGKLLATQ